MRIAIDNLEASILLSIIAEALAGGLYSIYTNDVLKELESKIKNEIALSNLAKKNINKGDK